MSFEYYVEKTWKELNNVDYVTCDYKADYSSYPGYEILPFVFTLNKEESVLYPRQGEHQKFCYDIVSVGKDSSKYKDLSSFILGICDQIRQRDIAEVKVIKDGIAQKVVWGQNIDIKTPQQPDVPTGCCGLKFKFSLKKRLGKMKVCISLHRPYRIGPVNVCLAGDDAVATGLSICGPVCGGGDASCDYLFEQLETVSMPVKVEPFAEQGMPTVVCCGNPVIRPDTCCCACSNKCSFTISQQVCVRIPISFGATVETGPAAIQCGTVFPAECNCDKVEENAETDEA